MSTIVNGVGNDEGNISDFFNYYEECAFHTILDFPEMKAAKAIQMFLYPVLLVLATVGNLSSLILLKKLSVHAWSSCLYLAVLSLVELVVLYIRCGGEWIEKVANKNPSFEITNLSDAMCKTYLFVSNVLLQMWPWLMVALAVELTISTRCPLKMYHMCTTERARATMLLITILLVCLNLKFFWTWGINDHQGTPICLYTETFSQDFLNIIWPAIEMTVKHFLPLVAASACLLIIVLSLAPCGHIARNGGPVSYEPILKRYFLDLQALQQLRTASMVLVIMFVLVQGLTFVVEVILALSMRGIIQPSSCDYSIVFRTRITFVKVLRDACVYSFWSLKFFVYFACCASFRRRFFNMLKRCTPCCRKRAHDTDKDAERAANLTTKAANTNKRLDSSSTESPASNRNSLTRISNSSAQYADVEHKTTHV